MAKLILEMPDRAERTLAQLAADQALSVGEVLERAVTLYQLALQRTAGGDAKLSITAGDGHIVANIDVRR